MARRSCDKRYPLLGEQRNGHDNGRQDALLPYSINGANEDNGTDALYIIHALLVQAFGEDGLPSNGFASPARQFEQEADMKYYIKSESSDHGLYTAYIAENTDGSISWKTMTGAQAVADDNAAWYVSFNPENSFYIFKNAATGHYLTYNTAKATMEAEAKAAPEAGNYLQLMRGRVGFSTALPYADIGSSALRPR